MHIVFQVTTIQSSKRLTSTWLYRIFFVILFVVTKSAKLSWYELMTWKVFHVRESNTKSSHKNKDFSFLCGSACSLDPESARDISTWKRIKIRPLRGQQKASNLILPSEKALCFWKTFQPFNLPFQKGLEETSRKFAIFRFFFYPKREISYLMTHLGQNILPKKMKFLYCDLCHKPSFKKMYPTIQISLQLAQ